MFYTPRGHAFPAVYILLLMLDWLGEKILMIYIFLQVYAHYSSGTFRFGPLHQLSLVGTVHEEAGGYFPEFLGMLEQNPFLRLVSSITVPVIAIVKVVVLLAVLTDVPKYDFTDFR